ncbi:MAG TPA: acyl-CoA dehydrogenase [Acidimicrobiales bacterium]|nr:acyl-CoA dehydrogenase [Acidimicrobiales bacterium]
MSSSTSSLGISDNHVELAATVRRWAEARGLLSQARATLDGPARAAVGAGSTARAAVGAGHTDETLPPWWGEVAELGWLGLAVSAERGGQGHGLAEQALVLEELGRCCAPGPLLPTVVAAVAIDRWAPDADLAGPLVDGTMVGGFALGGELVAEGGEGSARVSGRVRGVWGGARAERFVVPVARPGEAPGAGSAWCVVDRSDVEVEALAGFDPTRGLAELRLDGVEVGPGRWLCEDEAAGGPEGPARLAELLASAEALGVTDWCVRTAAEHAATRVQFGRPIGQFQAVKHHCADMLVSLETARGAVWDAARAIDAGEPGAALAQAAAAALAPEAAFRAAQDCIQVLGGIGYTWEHDAHIFLKRAASLRHLLPAPAVARRRVATAMGAGQRRHLSVELPAEAEALRADVRAFVADLQTRDRAAWRARLADEGYLAPHWPRPWGRDASAVQQLVIDEELAAARIRRPHLAVAAWALPTIIEHGSPAQRERFVGPSLRGEITWCQMFSEPGAGSDLASLSTRADRVAGGWSITGQKVWTSMAREADWAICLARTDPAAPKHDSIGCFLVDMTTPGIEVRPLRELTGMAMFNEVFLTDVFVPDDCVVGSPTGGWAYARTTLANERVSMAAGSSFGPGVRALFDLAEAQGLAQDRLVLDRLGGLAVDAHAIAVLGLRTTLRAIGGLPSGPEASVRKLAAVEHEQAIQEAGLALLGSEAALTDGPGGPWTAGFLGNRALSIAGGTSEIQRNVIAERMLGLPKDP